MKKLLWSAVIFCLFFSCKKSKDILDVTYRFTLNNDFTIPKTADSEYALPDSAVTIKGPDITNTVPDEFKKNRVNIDKIKSLSIETVTLRIKSPEGQNFGFIKNVKIYMGSNGKGETLVATRDNINTISPAPTVLSLNAENADITPYIKAPTYYIKTQITLARTHTQDILAGSEVKCKVVANPLN